MENKFEHLLLTRKETAQLLGISVNSFDKYFRSNPELKSLRIGSETRYPFPLLLKFIETQSAHHL